MKSNLWRNILYFLTESKMKSLSEYHKNNCFNRSFQFVVKPYDFTIWFYKNDSELVMNFNFAKR